MKEELQKKMQALEEALLMPLGAERQQVMDNLYAWFSEHKEDEEVRAAMPAFLDVKMRETKKEIQTLRGQMEEVYDILPLAYIAQTYFGKSRAWLYQRLNGYKIRGRAYALNAAQKQIFNTACRDISRRIGSFQLA